LGTNDQISRDKTHSAHAICWTSGDESEAMWRLCCPDGENEKEKGQGLALRSTLAKLEAFVAHHDLFISPVSYRFYHEGDGFDDELDPFMDKRKGFECEQEVWILKYDEAHYSKLRSCDEPEYPEFSNSLVENGTAALPDELPKYVLLDWSLTGAIHAITVSPYTFEAYESKARRDIAAIDPLVVVELSVLSERRFAPNF